MSLIEIRDVHKWYGEFHVLKGISERVEKGEVLVICWAFRVRQELGPSVAEPSGADPEGGHPL